MVKEGGNGFILKVGDVAGLVKVLEDLILNVQKRKNMGLESLEIISDWNYDACIEGILGALEFIRKNLI